MSEHETPSNQHPAISKDMTVSDYRLQEVERAVRQLSRQFKEFMDAAHEKEAGHILAIERCSTHGRRLDELEETEKENNRVVHKRIDHLRVPGRPSRLTASAAWTALIGAIGAVLNSLFHKGGP